MNKILTISAATLALTALHAASARADDYCREYTRNVTIGGQVEHAYGQACRQADGTWKIMNEQQGDQVIDATPPPPDARVSYVIQDQQPVYVQPTYVTYAPYPAEYEYGYPFFAYDRGWYGRDWHGGGYYGRGGYGYRH